MSALGTFIKLEFELFLGRGQSSIKWLVFSFVKISRSVWILLLGVGTLYSIFTIIKNIDRYAAKPTSIRTETILQHQLHMLNVYVCLNSQLGVNKNFGQHFLPRITLVHP